VVVLERELLDTSAVPKFGARRSRLRREMEVEPAALRHPDQRLRAGAHDAPAVASAKHEAVDDVLHHWLDFTGRMSECTPREPTAARLVARKR
jgi:hypothetical protein